nr:nuclear transport factor 2 family protein [Roseospira goensis]
MTRYGAAWTSGDVAAIGDLFTAEATYRETPFAPALSGRGAIEGYWAEGARDAQTDVRFDFTVWAVDGDVCLTHWTAAFTRVPWGQRVRLDGVFRLVFDSTDPDAPRCRHLQEWWHRDERRDGAIPPTPSGAG